MSFPLLDQISQNRTHSDTSSGLNLDYESESSDSSRDQTSKSKHVASATTRKRGPKCLSGILRHGTTTTVPGKIFHIFNSIFSI